MSTLKIDSLLAELERLDKEATPGPWKANYQDNNCLTVDAQDGTCIVEFSLAPSAGNLIATYRNSVPKLIAILRVYREALNEIGHAKGRGMDPSIYMFRDISRALAEAERIAGEGK